MKKIFKHALLVIRGKKLLIVRERGCDFWQTVGGRAEDGETPEQCLDREVGEEIGTEVDKSSLRYFGDFEGPTPNYKDTVVHITAHLGEVVGNVKPSGEVAEIAWVGAETDLNLAFTLGKKIMPALVEGGLL